MEVCTAYYKIHTVESTKHIFVLLHLESKGKLPKTQHQRTKKDKSYSYISWKFLFLYYSFIIIIRIV